LRVIEASSFIAAPSCGLHLSQLGAEILRVDQIRGGLDYRRWPLAPSGASLYWEGLNKGKKSVGLNLRSREGRDLLCSLATTPGANAGILLTNYPSDSFLSYAALKKLREDIIVLRIIGRSDGTSAVDYTVNSVYGIPYMTGPASLGDAPVNHVLPAWDLLTGAYAAYCLLAALHHRNRHGIGQEIRVSLEDVAIASLGNIGSIADSTLNGADRARNGNDLYGAFGRDFETTDRRRVMVVAITEKQWSALLGALGVNDAVHQLEEELDVSFGVDEGLRYTHRDRLYPIVEKAIKARAYADVAKNFNEAGVCWGPYRTLSESISAEPALSEANPMLSLVTHRSGQRYLTPGAAATFDGLERRAPGSAPDLGEHTSEVLSGLLRLSGEEIAALRDRGVIDGPKAK